MAYYTMHLGYLVCIYVCILHLNYLSICLSIYLSIYLSLSLSLYLFIDPPITQTFTPRPTGLGNTMWTRLLSHYMAYCFTVSFISFIFFFVVVMGGGTLWHLHRFLQCIKYILHKFTSSTILLHLPHPRFLE
jgi:hypothetical protein